MPSMFTTYTFNTGEVIDSLQMNTNFNDVKAAYNANAVQVDGSVQATAASLGAGIVTTAKLADLGVTTAKIADLSVTNAKIADATIAIGKLGSSVVSSGTWTPTVTHNGSIASGQWYKVGDIMMFNCYVLLTGTFNSTNTIGIGLPTGTYWSDQQGSVDVYWTGGIFGTSYYTGKVLVGTGGNMNVYVVSSSGFMTHISNAYNGQSAESVVINFGGAIRKSA